MDVREEMAKFVEALAEDEQLRAWFESFYEAAPAQRQFEFTAMAAKMQAAGEHPELIQATALLADAEVFAAVRATLQEILSEE